MWTTKYAPKTVKEILGNPVAIKKITEWIKTWSSSSSHGVLLLIGNAGLGKTTAVNLIGKSLGYSVSEFNASDERAASQIRELAVFDNKTLDGYFTATTVSVSAPKLSQKRLVLMDEVDGMQPAGMTELITIAETSKCPIICICNTETTAVQKLKKVEKVRFYSIPESDVMRRVQSILKAEKLSVSVSDVILTDIISGCGGDVRKTLNQIQWLCLGLGLGSGKKLTTQLTNETETIPESDNIFNAVKTLFNSSGSSIDYCLEYYYDDPMFIPLFVQENYISGVAGVAKRPAPETDLADIAESLSIGDTVSNLIYKDQLFDLMPYHGILTTVMPVKRVKRLPVNARITFPQLLGKCSSADSKNSSMNALLPLNNHSKPSDRLLYIVKITFEMFKNQQVNSIVELLKNYHLTAEDLKEIYILTGHEDLFKSVDKKKKSALTRACPSIK